jgi:hypothetical protein
MDDRREMGRVDWRQWAGSLRGMGGGRLAIGGKWEIGLCAKGRWEGNGRSAMGRRSRPSRTRYRVFRNKG